MEVVRLGFSRESELSIVSLPPSDLIPIYREQREIVF
jgi:hypothetical protein